MRTYLNGWIATGFLVSTLVSAAVAQRPPAPIPQAAAAQPQTQPQVEVCFVLDTTGSMGGLIAGAKAKIWAIANQIVSAKPSPRVKFGLVAYRDRGDNYVTKRLDLTEDIDAVYAELQTFQAGGGGDGPESVNQALNEAVTLMKWSPDVKTLRIIFLVGDAPPHMDYENDVAYTLSCQTAARAGLIVNTIQCGQDSRTEEVWREIARRAEGQFASIGQTGDVRVVETPLDAEIAALNVEAGKTLLPYGRADVRAAVAKKQEVAEAAPPAAAADRAAFMGAGGRLVGATGYAGEGGELIDDLKAGSVKLAEIREEELPNELRNLPADQRAAKIAEFQRQRERIQSKIADLTKQRREFIDKELARQSREGGKDGFDQQVARMLAEQAARKGIATQSKP